MFSRIALRTGSFAPLVFRQAPNGSSMLIVRASSQSAIAKQIEDWEKSNKVYYGPERDLTNFPHPKMADTPPPTRLGTLPESWFNFLYEKTGVTGPYMLGVGAVTFMLSKEFWVIEHGFTEWLAFWAAFAFMAKKLGPGMGASLDKMNEDYMAKHWNEPLTEAKQQAKAVIDATEKAIWQEEGQKMMFDAKRENIDLQLEAAYRQRVAEVHTAVKKRLDYQVATETTKRRFEQDHMVNWIVESVKKGITPKQEKESIKSCLAHLKSLTVAHAPA